MLVNGCALVYRMIPLFAHQGEGNTGSPIPSFLSVVARQQATTGSNCEDVYECCAQSSDQTVPPTCLPAVRAGRAASNLSFAFQT